MHFAVFLMIFYQCIKFHLVLFNTFREETCPRQVFLLQKKIKAESNTINTSDRKTVLTVCNFPYDPLSAYKVTSNYLQYFKRYAPDKLIIAKYRKENNSVITCTLHFF